MNKIKKIINRPENIVGDVLDGIVAMSDGAVLRIDNTYVLHRPERRPGKVGLVIGGGAGHEPMYSALVGPGLADASVSGEIFAAPNPEQVAIAGRAADAGKGVLFVYGNYGGDIMNFDMGAELLEIDGIATKTVLVTDDAAVADRRARRGIAGAVYQVKVAGYACDTCDDLESAAALVEQARNAISTMGVAVRPGSLPNTGKPTFEIGDDDIEIGMGVHGERGVTRKALPLADDLVDEMFRRVADDLELRRGERVALLLNNLGATTFGELMIVNRHLRKLLAAAGLEVARTDVGAIFTSQEMAGFSISLMRLDARLEAALDYPASSPGFSQAARR
jgi:dihydroxyacetone kinase-like protein